MCMFVSDQMLHLAMEIVLYVCDHPPSCHQTLSDYPPPLPPTPPPPTVPTLQAAHLSPGQSPPPLIHCPSFTTGSQRDGRRTPQASASVHLHTRVIGSVPVTTVLVSADAWTSRWVESKHKSDYGKFVLTAGKFYGDAEKDKGEQCGDIPEALWVMICVSGLDVRPVCCRCVEGGIWD